MKIPFIGKAQEVEKAVRENASAPHPENWAFNYAWFNDRFLQSGEYRSRDGEENSIVGASVNWISRALESTDLKLYRGESDTPVERHSIWPILRQPNRGHTYSEMLWSIVRSLIVNGNCIIQLLPDEGPPFTSFQVLPWERNYLRLPNRIGEDVEYRTLTLSGVRTIPSTHIVHIIWNPSQKNQYIGQSPLEAALPALLLDKGATEGAYGRLMAPIAGMVISAKEGKTLTPAQQDEMKKQTEKLRGHKAGEMVMVNGPVEVTELSGNIARFNYKEIFMTTEGRVAAQLGIPPSVLQMASGMQASRVGATMTEEMRAAWVNGVMPMAKKIELGLNNKLLPKMGFGDLRLEFDFSGIDFMSEEQRKAKTDRIIEEMNSGLRTRESAARELGIDTSDIPTQD